MNTPRILVLGLVLTACLGTVGCGAGVDPTRASTGTTAASPAPGLPPVSPDDPGANPAPGSAPGGGPAPSGPTGGGAPGGGATGGGGASPAPAPAPGGGWSQLGAVNANPYPSCTWTSNGMVCH